MVYYTAFDPAISEDSAADACGKVTVGVVSDGPQRGMIYVVEAWGKKGSLLQQVEWLFDSFRRFKEVAVGIESVAYQQALVDTVRALARQRGISLPVVEIKTHKDKIAKAMAIAPLFENGDVWFRQQPDLIEQLTRLSPRYQGHDDIVLQLVKDRPRILPPMMPEPVMPAWDSGLTLCGVSAGGNWTSEVERGWPAALRD